jgi:GDP-L-fucose synthase
LEISSKIYIAGHTGLVGSAIHRQLIAAGYTNIMTRDLEELDLTSQADVEAFFAKEKPEYVIDAAAKVGGIMANNTYRAQFIYENLMIQNNIIHSAYIHGVKKLLFLGSSCIYPKNAPQPLKEEYLLTGLLELTNEPYAIAKIAGIKMCESYYRQYGCNFISVMPTNLYGPNDNYNLETSHVLPAIIRKMHLARCLETANWEGIRKDLDKRPVEGVTGANSEQEILKILSKFGINSNSPTHQLASSPITIALWGTGNIFREFLHVDDMAQACIYVMNNIDAKKLYEDMNVSQINIGTGNDITIYDVALLVRKIVGYKGEITWDSSKPDGTYKKQLDVSRLNSLGWKESIPLANGIKQVYEGYLL